VISPPFPPPSDRHFHFFSVFPQMFHSSVLTERFFIVFFLFFSFPFTAFYIIRLRAIRVPILIHYIIFPTPSVVSSDLFWESLCRRLRAALPSPDGFGSLFNLEKETDSPFALTDTYFLAHDHNIRTAWVQLGPCPLAFGIYSGRCNDFSILSPMTPHLQLLFLRPLPPALQGLPAPRSFLTTNPSSWRRERLIQSLPRRAFFPFFFRGFRRRYRPHVGTKCFPLFFVRCDERSVVRF